MKINHVKTNHGAVSIFMLYIGNTSHCIRRQTGYGRQPLWKLQSWYSAVLSSLCNYFGDRDTLNDAHLYIMKTLLVYNAVYILALSLSILYLS